MSSAKWGQLQYYTQRAAQVNDGGEVLSEMPATSAQYMLNIISFCTEFSKSLVSNKYSLNE